MLRKITCSIALWLVAGLLLTGIAPAADSTVPEAMVQRDVKRFEALGGVYQPQCFPGFPAKYTPFSLDYKVNSRLLNGKMLLYNKDGIRIRANFYCDPHGTVYLQYWVPDGRGGILPFGWQDVLFPCSAGGAASGQDPVYFDLDGDGRPEIKFDQLGRAAQSTAEKMAIVWTFQGDVLPGWVRARAGKSLKDLSSARFPAGTRYWRDDAMSVADPYDMQD